MSELSHSTESAVISFPNGKRIVVDDAVRSSFWGRVDRRGDEDCWPWVGSVHRGYGVISLRFGFSHVRAHRLAYVIHQGQIPAGLMVCHHCDNPPCCNPSHLFLGTATDNNTDRHRKGRSRGGAPPRFGSKNCLAKLNEAQVRQIIVDWLPAHANAAIAFRFGVSKKIVADIRSRRTWPRVWEEVDRDLARLRAGGAT